MSRWCAVGLAVAVAMAQPVIASAAPASEASTSSREPADRCHREHRNLCREKKIAGGVALGLGIAGLGVGIGLVATPNAPIADLPAYERSYRAPGAAVVGLSVLLVVTGIALLVDAIRNQRGRKRSRGGRAR